MAENQIPMITIDGTDYALSALTDEAKAQVANVQLVDQKLREAQQQIAILQTARNAYVTALQEALPPK